MEELYPQMSAHQAIAIVRKRNEVAGVAEESVAAGVTGAGVTGAGVTRTRSSSVSVRPRISTFCEIRRSQHSSVAAADDRELRHLCGRMLTYADVC